MTNAPKDDKHAERDRPVKVKALCCAVSTEMAAAGRDVLLEWDWSTESHSEAAVKVYLAMKKAQLESAEVASEEAHKTPSS